LIGINHLNDGLGTNLLKDQYDFYIKIQIMSLAGFNVNCIILWKAIAGITVQSGNNSAHFVRSYIKPAGVRATLTGVAGNST